MLGLATALEQAVFLAGIVEQLKRAPLWRSAGVPAVIEMPADKFDYLTYQLGILLRSYDDAFLGRAKKPAKRQYTKVFHAGVSQ